MSVEFYPCSRCNEVYCDCGDYTTCNESDGGCGRDWCSDDCAEEDGYIEGYCKIDNENCDKYGENDECLYSECEHYVRASCNYCRGESVTDEKLLYFALKLLNMNKEELTIKFKEEI